MVELEIDVVVACTAWGTLFLLAGTLRDGEPTAFNRSIGMNNNDKVEVVLEKTWLHCPMPYKELARLGRVCVQGLNLDTISLLLLSRLLEVSIHCSLYDGVRHAHQGPLNVIFNLVMSIFFLTVSVRFESGELLACSPCIAGD